MSGHVDPDRAPFDTLKAPDRDAPQHILSLAVVYAQAAVRKTRLIRTQGLPVTGGFI